MVLTRTGDQIYHASARSQWWRIFRSAYDSTLVLTPVGVSEHAIQGSQDLWLFGGYTITGRVNPQRLDAVFVAGGHQGKMELHRPGASSEKP